MNENEREPGGGGPSEPREPVDQGSAPGPTGERPGGQGQWDRDSARRRRGRRGRGGRPPMPGQGFRPQGQGQPFRPQGQGFRPQAPGQFRPPAPEHEDEGSGQTRELAAYERRQQAQQQRQQWRGPGFRAPSSGPRPMGAPMRGSPIPFRPGGPPRMGAPRGPMRPGMARGGQRYQDIVRRATGGPRVSAIPAQDAGEPIAGPHAVLEALRAGRVVRRILVAQERGVRTGAVNDLMREAQERHVQVLTVDRKEVDRLSPTIDHQGVVGIAEGRAGVELDELLLHLDTITEPALVLIIDSLQDPQNFGVLLRSAEGAGVDGVVIPRHRQVGLTPAVARTSAGASEHLLIADVANLRQAIDAIKEKGIWVVGTDDTGEMEWDEVDYRGPTAIVVGGEAEGIRRLVLEGCDQVVRVPMQGQVSSLNAAAAGTVVLFEALRQRIRDAAPPTSVRRQERPAPAADAEEEGTDEETSSDELALDDEEGAIDDGALEMGTLDESVQDDAPVAVPAEDEVQETDDPGADEVEALEMGTSGADEPAPEKPKRAPAKRTASKTTKTTRKKAE
jgi:23S rRNA (guanosine2251-2'-O)-methyltransferase